MKVLLELCGESVKILNYGEEKRCRKVMPCIYSLNYLCSTKYTPRASHNSYPCGGGGLRPEKYKYTGFMNTVSNSPSITF